MVNSQFDQPRGRRAATPHCGRTWQVGQGSTRQQSDLLRGAVRDHSWDCSVRTPQRHRNRARHQLWYLTSLQRFRAWIVAPAWRNHFSVAINRRYEPTLSAPPPSARVGPASVRVQPPGRRGVPVTYGTNVWSGATAT